MGVHLTNNDSFIKFTKSVHTHMPVPEKLEIRKMLLDVKNRINRETTAVGKIYTEENWSSQSLNYCTCHGKHS